jgi:hypothetical protein
VAKQQRFYSEINRVANASAATAVAEEPEFTTNCLHSCVIIARVVKYGVANLIFNTKCFEDFAYLVCNSGAYMPTNLGDSKCDFVRLVVFVSKKADNII